MKSKTIIRWIPNRHAFGKLVSDGEFDELLDIAARWLKRHSEDESVVFEVSKYGTPGLFKVETRTRLRHVDGLTHVDGVENLLDENHVADAHRSLIDECHDVLLETVGEAIWGASDEEIVEEVR